MNAPSVSAVIVTYNSAAVIAACLASLRAELPSAEVIVVDNASSDDTCVRCDEFPGTVLLENSTNMGFGRACNRGARVAAGSHILFLNPDVRLLKVDAVGLRSELLREPFGLVGPLFRDRGKAAPLLLSQSAWPVDAVIHGLGPLRPRELPALPKIPFGRDARWPAGAMLLAARAEFLDGGGFSPEFFLYYEDRDLASRYRAAGFRVGTTRSIVALHTHGTSSASDDSLRIVVGGWEYLSWIEYLSIWHGDADARHAVAWAERLRTCAYGVLARLESRGVFPERVARKRRQLCGIDRFVRWQSSQAVGTADDGFCPRARKIIAGVL